MCLFSPLKKCFRCGGLLPRTDFYPHPRMADGLLGKCKECTKRDVKANREKRVEYYRQADREREVQPNRKLTHYRTTRDWRSADPRRSRCHRAVARALMAGTLSREPCVVCGSGDSHAHHEDYDKPLEVVWLCDWHHKELHRRKKQAA